MTSLPTATRADALDNWTASQVATNPMGFNGLLLNGVTYGNGRYVAVGMYASDDAGLIQTSEDGLQWTMRTTRDYSVLDLYDVAFGNGTFVAVGWGYFNGRNIYHSTDGITWVPHYTEIGNINRVIFGGGIFVAVGDGLLLGGSSTTNRNIYTSPDGVTWVARSSGAPPGDVRPMIDVACGPGRYLAVDTAGNHYISTSGAAWTRVNNAGSGGAISFCNGLFIQPAGVGTNRLSTDGVNWAVLTNNTGASFGRVIYAAGHYLALAGDSEIYTSSDTTNWTRRSSQVFANMNLRAIAYGDRRFVVAGHAYSGLPVLPVAYASDPVVDLDILQGVPPKLRLSGLVGGSYRIDYRDGVSSGNWSQGIPFPLTTSPFDYYDGTATNSARFYRAVLLP